MLLYLITQWSKQSLKIQMIYHFSFQASEMSDNHIRQICREILQCEYHYRLNDDVFLCLFNTHLKSFHCQLS